MKNSDQPAFSMPFSRIHVKEEGWEGNSEHYGLTKREYFAGLAMQGILSNDGYRTALLNTKLENKNITDEDLDSAIAKESIRQADELLKQLES